MKKKLLLIAAVAVTLAVCLVLACCHKHTPGPAATCTDPQICTECGKFLVKATGHEPGKSATCTDAQVCTKCGEVLTAALGHDAVAATCSEKSYCADCGEILGPALGHDVNGETGKCNRCGEQIVEAGLQYITPGAHGTSSDNADKVVPETENTGHYNAAGTPYYGGYIQICGDYGYEPLNLSTQGSEDYASIITAFGKKYSSLNVSSLIAPKAGAYLASAGVEDYHDSVAANIKNTYGKMDKTITTVDAVSVMDQHRGEYMFYRTDINWTGLGAYYAYTAYCKANGMTALPLDSYQTIIHTGFRGGLYNASGSKSDLDSNRDYTEIHFPQTGYTMRYTYNGTTWYNGKAVDEGTEDDPNYTYNGVYLDGGVHPLVEIKTDNKNGKVLLMVKDPFGNALAPYLIDHYETIVLVDYTYDLVENVSDLIKDYKVTDVLILSNCQAAVTASQQQSLKAVLES